MRQVFFAQVFFGRAKRLGVVFALLLVAACAASRPGSTPPTEPAPPPQPLSWTASIGGLHNLTNNQICTATLVQRNVIVTAAHCLSDGQASTSPQQFVFVPNEGAMPTFRGLAVLSVQAIGRHVQQGVIGAETAADDWALLRIDPAPEVLRPVAVNSLRWAEIEARLAAGDRFFSGGYGNPGLLALTQHFNCQPVDAAKFGQFLDDGLVASDCAIRPRDSGGPMILVDITGRPHLFAITSGIGRPFSDRPLGIGVISGSFIKYLNGLNVSDGRGDTAPEPAG
jgi:V8-like Glu-specific endopeptidase